MTAIRTSETNEEATIYIKDLGIFVRVKLADDSPAVPSLRMLPRENDGLLHSRNAGEQPSLIDDGSHSTADPKTMSQSSE